MEQSPTHHTTINHKPKLMFSAQTKRKLKRNIAMFDSCTEGIGFSKVEGRVDINLDLKKEGCIIKCCFIYRIIYTFCNNIFSL